MKNIIIAGVGGQGLVLASNIIGQVALKAGLETKTNDVVGLSQRGGMVWGSVRIGEKVYSPNIKEKDGDILLGMEPLEALRMTKLLRDGGLIILNTKEVYPTPALLEVEDYPEEDIEALKDSYRVIEIDVLEEAKRAGNPKAANTVMLGVLAKNMDISPDIWEEVLRENVPEKAIEENIKAFHIGYDY